ncbi:hypothetical protein BYT27DRAFT_7205847, partial [Phlegmacium glaucopus]
MISLNIGSWYPTIKRSYKNRVRLALQTNFSDENQNIKKIGKITCVDTDWWHTICQVTRSTDDHCEVFDYFGPPVLEMGSELVWYSQTPTLMVYRARFRIYRKHFFRYIGGQKQTLSV